MRKIVMLFGLIMLMVACQSSSKSNVDKVSTNLTYFKDARTGLCFAAVNSNSYGGLDITSITCVPCDSLKRVSLTIVNK